MFHGLSEDLCTGCEAVQDKMAAYLSHLQELGVAGVRLDAAKHIPKDDLAKIFAILGGKLNLRHRGWGILLSDPFPLRKVKGGASSLFKYVEARFSPPIM